jgi:hypothetical protein
MILFCFSSCDPIAKRETIDEFVLFGSSGFYLKDSTNWKFDSTRLYIRKYFEFKKDSFVRYAIIPDVQSEQFYSIKSADTVGFNNLINNILINRKYESEYLSNVPEIYDGFYYILFYKTSNNKEFVIHYTPHHLPDSLRMIHDYIDEIITFRRKKNSIIDKFIFNKITKTEAIKLFNKYPFVPMIKTEEIKFKVPQKNEHDE